jgi:hypothetical protein
LEKLIRQSGSFPGSRQLPPQVLASQTPQTFMPVDIQQSPHHLGLRIGVDDGQQRVLSAERVPDAVEAAQVSHQPHHFLTDSPTHESKYGSVEFHNGFSPV